MMILKEVEVLWHKQLSRGLPVKVLARPSVELPSGGTAAAAGDGLAVQAGRHGFSPAGFNTGSSWQNRRQAAVNQFTLACK
jgi:hypothetical protein